MKYDIEIFNKAILEEYNPLAEQILEALEETRRDLRRVILAANPIIHCLFDEILYFDVETLYAVVIDTSTKYTISEEVPST